jgi:hypothetical protein
MDEGFVVVDPPAIDPKGVGGKKRRGGRKHRKQSVGAPHASASSSGQASLRSVMQAVPGSTMEERKAGIFAKMQEKSQGDEPPAQSGVAVGDKETGGCESGDDKVTNMSKRSSTRSHVSKGSGHVARNTARVAKHLQTQGLQYSPHEAARRRIEGAEVATSMHGTMATTMYGHVVRGTPMATEEELAEVRRRAEEVVNTMPVAMRSVIQWVNGDYFCTLCKKAGSAHLLGQAHMLRSEEHMLGTVMSGIATGPRRFSSVGGGGLPTALSKKGLLEHWGDGLESLVSYTREFHKKGPFAWNRMQVFHNQVQDYLLCAVSYSGTSKYEGMQLVAYEDIADTLETSGAKPHPPSGCSWWPVIRLRFTDEMKRTIGDGDGDDPGYVPIICFYQLMQQPPRVWTMYLPKKSMEDIPEGAEP